MTNKIILSNSTVVVESLEFHDAAVAEFLEQVEEVDRATAFLSAAQVGVFCLSRTKANRDTEFVRRQVEGLMNEVTLAVAKIPATTQEALIAKIGTANGQVLAPIQSLLDQVQSSTAARLREVKDLLARDIDPAQESSTLGRALRALRDLLDPHRTDYGFPAGIVSDRAHKGVFGRRAARQIFESDARGCASANPKRDRRAGQGSARKRSSG